MESSMQYLFLEIKANEMDFDFDDCYWHDSILESIYIDRRDPGHNDTIELVVKWYEDDSRSRIVFSDVRMLKATLNFGIIANETIDTAYLAPMTKRLPHFIRVGKDCLIMLS